MPLRGRDAGHDSRREKEPACRPCYNPFTVSVQTGEREAIFALPSELRDSKIRRSACVARPVTKAEAANNKKAHKALMDEWGRLRKIKTWDESKVQELRDVKIKMKGETFHIGRLFAMLVEKNAELPEGHKDRKFKGSVVFDGSDVVDQGKNLALFQELPSCPATRQASKSADTYGLFEDHDIQQADARQAHAQSKLGGAPTWVRLPKEAWPGSWAGMIDPVRPSLLALHGHLDAGGFREQRCEAHAMSKGFVP
eukprot:2032467-Pyramimonas_sp.AAC.1